MGFPLQYYYLQRKQSIDVHNIRTIFLFHSECNYIHSQIGVPVKCEMKRETERNERKRNEIYQNETKRNQTKRNVTERNKMKRNLSNANETKRNYTMFISDIH